MFNAPLFQLPHAFTLAASVENLPLLTTIAAGFAAAWLFGLITHRLGLSPIVGYLAAGVLIGRHTPGFKGDEGLAQQLAEIGVILLMFGVGLHFHVKDLLAVRRVAIPGAVGQSFLAALVTVAIFHFGFDFPLRSTLVLGMAMAVASTVVLLRVLMDRGMLSSSHGHVAVGWLIVEDIFTVLALVLVPVLAGSSGEGVGDGASGSGPGTLATIGWAIAKLVALVGIVLLAGSRVVPWILERVARLRSGELFTLTVLVLSIAVAVGAAALFGASVALGAFLAGMVVAQSPLSHQAAADALPLRDAFSVLFFVSVGMLFNPAFVVEQPLMVLAGLAVVLLVKPLAALAIVAALGYPAKTALTVAIGLAQIGEFSFILAQVAQGKGLMPEAGVNVLVAAAMISITLNPLLFRSIDRIEAAIQGVPIIWKLLNGRAERRIAAMNAAGATRLSEEAAASENADATDPRSEPSRAIVVGYGPVGRLVDALLRDAGVRTTVVDMNVDTVRTLADEGRTALYGDASRREVLDQARIATAAHLIVTLPSAESRTTLVMAARELNPTVEITVRARYLAEREGLVAAGASTVICEEGEAGVALARHVMERRGLDSATTDKLLAAVRQLWKLKK